MRLPAPSSIEGLSLSQKQYKTIMSWTVKTNKRRERCERVQAEVSDEINCLLNI